MKSSKTRLGVIEPVQAIDMLMLEGLLYISKCRIVKKKGYENIPFMVIFYDYESEWFDQSDG